MRLPEVYVKGNNVGLFLRPSAQWTAGIGVCVASEG